MDKEIDERRKGIWNNRNAIYNCRSFLDRFFSFRQANKSIKTCSQHSSGKYKRSFQIRALNLLKDAKGSANSIEFIIFLPVILFVIFGSVDYYVAQMQYNHLENIKNYYTNVMKIEGTLDYEDMYELIDTLSNQGFQNVEIEIEPEDKVVYRNIERPEESRMFLSIKAEPKIKPFAFGKLLGIKDDEDAFYFHVIGGTLSEKPSM